MSPGRSLQSWVNHGDDLVDRGDFKAAAEAYRQALTIDPQDDGIHASLSIALYGLRQNRAALEANDDALALHPRSDRTWRIRALILMGLKRKKQALAAAGEAVTLFPGEAANHLTQAQVLEDMDKFAAAEDAFRIALNLAPSSIDCLTRYGHFLVRRGRSADAAPLVESAAAIAPGSFDVLILRGHFALLTGKTADARDFAAWALSTNATDPDALGLLCAVKAKSSPFMGLWWRWAIWMSTMTTAARWGVVIGLYLLFQVGRRTVLPLAPVMVQQVVLWSWIVFCIYTWVAPVVFDQMVKNELKRIRLKSTF